MDNTRIKMLLDDIRDLELTTGRLRYKALPILWFSIGLFSGFFLNLAANVVHEIFNAFGLVYKIVVLFLTFAFVCLFLLYLRRTLGPIERNEKQLENKFGQLGELLIKGD